MADLTKKLLGIKDARSVRGRIARGNNVYKGGVPSPTPTGVNSQMAMDPEKLRRAAAKRLAGRKLTDVRTTATSGSKISNLKNTAAAGNKMAGAPTRNPPMRTTMPPVAPTGPVKPKTRG